MLRSDIWEAVCVKFLCQLTSQSADIMASPYVVHVSVHVRICVHVKNFSSRSTRPRNMLFLLKDTLSIDNEKLFNA